MVIINICKSYHLFFGCVLLALLFMGAGCADEQPSGTKVTDFTFTTLDGERISLSDYIGEKVVIIDLWATWCPPCIKGMPKMQALYEELSDQIEVIAVSVDSPQDASKVRDFVSDYNLTFKVTHDVTQDIQRRFPQARSIPYIVIIDKNGVKAKEFSGHPPNLKEMVLDVIRET